MTTENSTAPKRSVKHLKRTVQFPLKELGIVAEVKRPALTAWIAGGRLPDSLFNMLSDTKGGQAPELGGKEMKDAMSFAIELAKDSFVWPRLVETADAESDDELEPGHIPLNDLSDFLNWAMSGASGIPVETTSGEVSPEAVNSFRPDGELQGNSSDGGDVQQ